MGLSCGAQCAKYILFLFNVIFWLSGAAFIAVGAYIAIDKDLKILGDAVSTGDNHLKIAAYVIITVGVITFIVGFCGCCGAIKENQCLLGTYIALLSIILVISLAIGIYAAVKKNDVIKNMKKQAMKAIQKEYPPRNEKTGANFKKVIDDIQLKGKCCGVESMDEWRNSEWYKKNNPEKYKIPPSCCGSKKDDYSVVKKCQDGSSYYKKKCADYIENVIKSKAPVIIGIACGVAALEIFGIIFACCLCRSIRREYET